MDREKWEAMPMLGSPLWGVKDGKGLIIALGLTEELARLIAAAPALLEACENLVRGQLQSPSFEGYVEHAVSVAEAAVDKTKGK